MKANVDKFHFMLLCPSLSENKIPVTLTVDDLTFVSEEEVTLLGLNIDKWLTMDNHVKLKCKKANAQLQVLKRLAACLSEDCKLSVVRSFIISHFTYCSPLIHFTSAYHKNKMEKIQYRSLRYVFNDYQSTYETLLKKAKMCTLEILREKAIIIEMYKCFHGRRTPTIH